MLGDIFRSLFTSAEKPARRGLVIGPDGTVINVVMVDPEDTWTPPEGCGLMLYEEGGIGDYWDGKKLISPDEKALQDKGMDIV